MTTFTMTAEDFYQATSEVSPHTFCTEASTLRWNAFPMSIETEVGNGLPLVVHRVEKVEGDLQFVEYLQSAGCIRLRVFND